MQRVVIVASSPGAGKTSLARRLARRVDAPHIELDALFWGPNWTPVASDVFRARIAEAVTGERWVLDSNYPSPRELIWPRADTLVWLDYPLWLALARLVRRAFRGARSREELWPGTGNRESIRRLFLSRDSLLVYAVATYGRRRRRVLTGLADPAYAHLKVVRLRSPRETERWLESVAG